MSWTENYPQSQWYNLLFSPKLRGGQKIIFTVGITQINVREKKQTVYLNFEDNLNTFSTFIGRCIQQTIVK